MIAMKFRFVPHLGIFHPYRFSAIDAVGSRWLGMKWFGLRKIAD